jgi:hypothetical protein
VARHERLADLRGGADPALLEIVEIAAADADRGDLDQDLARPQALGQLAEADVVGAMNEGRAHARTALRGP